MKYTLENNTSLRQHKKEVKKLDQGHKDSWNEERRLEKYMDAKNEQNRTKYNELRDKVKIVFNMWRKKVGEKLNLIYKDNNWLFWNKIKAPRGKKKNSSVNIWL